MRGVFAVLLALSCAVPGAARPDSPLPATTHSRTAHLVLPPQLGPGRHDAAGSLRCSERAPVLDQRCTYRLVHEGRATELWLLDAARRPALRYHVLHFLNGYFRDHDHAHLSVERNGAAWLVGLAGKSYYLIPDALLQPRQMAR